MKTQRVTLTDVEHATGTVVVVDVLRAFTTAPVALARGAARIVLVGTVEEAFAARATDPDVLLMGEIDAVTVPGFDLGNSPAAVAEADVRGRTIVHRSSAGTQGVVRATAADRLLVTSFVVADATARALQDEDAVTFVITGIHSGMDGDEDIACADYLEALLSGTDPDPAPFLARIRTSTAGRKFAAGDAHPDMQPVDLEWAARLDAYDFALPVVTRDGQRVLLPPGS